MVIVMSQEVQPMALYGLQHSEPIAVPGSVSRTAPRRECCSSQSWRSPARAPISSGHSRGSSSETTMRPMQPQELSAFEIRLQSNSILLDIALSPANSGEKNQDRSPEKRETQNPWNLFCLCAGCLNISYGKVTNASYFQA